MSFPESRFRATALRPAEGPLWIRRNFERRDIGDENLLQRLATVAAKLRVQDSAADVGLIIESYAQTQNLCSICGLAMCLEPIPLPRAPTPIPDDDEDDDDLKQREQSSANTVLPVGTKRKRRRGGGGAPKPRPADKIR